MFTTKQYRAKAAEYTELVKTANGQGEVWEFQKLERSFTVLADNEQWLADNHNQTIHAPLSDEKADLSEEAEEANVTLAEEEEHILRCLGAALIMQWNALPKELQRELFDNAGSVGALLDVPALRGQIARFLHKHKDGEGGFGGNQ